MTKLETLLGPYRAAEDSTAVVPIMDDTDAKRLLSAWLRMATQWKRPVGPMPRNSDERWFWLWEGLDADHEQLAVMANVSTIVLPRKLKTLVYSRLIYPDGSISKAARMVLSAYIKQNLPAMPSAKPKKRSK